MARTVGLKDVSFAKLLTDTISGVTYDTVKKYERSVSAKITPKTNSENLYSDDNIEDVLISFNEVDVEIELNQLSTATRSLVQGSKVVNGILVETKDDIAPYLAMVFKSKKSDGSYRYVCFYKGKFELAEDDYSTIEDKAKAQTAKLKGTFICRDYDNAYRLMADSDDTGVVIADLNSWFVTIPSVPTASSITTITVVSGKTAIVTNVSGTVLTVATGTTVTSLISSLSVDGGKGSFKVYVDNTKAVEATGSATVVSTMVVEATAQDITTKATYTITVA